MLLCLLVPLISLFYLSFQISLESLKTCHYFAGFFDFSRPISDHILMRLSTFSPQVRYGETYHILNVFDFLEDLFLIVELHLNEA